MRLPAITSAVLTGAVVLVAGCGGDDDAPAENPKPNTSAAATTRTSPSGQTTKLEVGVDPARPSPAGKPRGVALGTTLRVDTTTSRALPSPLTRYTLRTDDDFQLHAEKFPTCAKTDLEAGGPERCKPAKIGEGKAEVQARQRGPSQAKIQVFNAGSSSYLFHVQTPGLEPQVLPGKVKDDANGLQIEVSFSGGENEPITQLSLDTKNLKANDGTPLLGAPRKCDGFWSFEAETRYASGEKLRSRATVRCTPSS